MKHIFTKTRALYIALIATLLATSAIYAWTGPSGTAPNSNATAPLNVGSVAQTKAGSLGLTGSLVVSGLLNPGGTYYNLVNYAFNGTPTNGIKIKTNIPYTDGSQMPTIIIEGYNYGAQQPIGLLINWYVYGGAFTSYRVSSFGGYTPEIKLANESSKVVIYINDKQYYNRFSVRAYATGMGETISWFTGWTTADETLTGTNVVTLPYYNKFGTVEATSIVGPHTGNSSSATALAANGTNCAAGSYALGVDASGNAEGCTVLGTSVTGSGTANYHAKWSSASALTNSIVYDNGTNAGGGTASPTNKLSILGSTLTVGTQTSYALSAGNSAMTDFSIGSDASYAYLQSWSSKPLQINNQGNNVLFAGAGSVGIGNTAPAYKLDVTGQVRATTGFVGSLTGNASSATTATTATALAANGTNCAAGSYPLGVDASGNVESCTVIGSGVTGSGTASYLTKWATGSTVGNSIVYDTGTNVGIGTTGPGFKLDVAGAGRFTAPAAVAAITSATAGALEVGEINVGASAGFVTALHQTTVYSSGYRQHLSIGDYRTASAWGGGMFVGLGGNDAYPTEYWLLGYGGNISHSNGYITTADIRSSIFYDKDNTAYYVDPASTSITNDMRANIFYDYGNTGYYVDPASTSNLNLVYSNDARSSIYYDKDNTGYYTDPASTTRLNTLYPNLINCMNGYCPSNNVMRFTPNLHLNALAGYAVIVDWDNGTTGATQTFRIGNGAGADVFYVTAAGATYAYYYYYLSDQNLKKDIMPITSALSRVRSLDGHYFTWKETNKKDIGLIAQEVEKVFPELVSRQEITDPKTGQKKDGFLTVEYGHMIAPIIEAIKELANKFDSAQTQLDDKQAQLDSQQRQLIEQQKIIQEEKQKSQAQEKRIKDLELKLAKIAQ